MKLRQIIISSYGVATACLVVACSSGSGSPFGFGSPYEQYPGEFNPPSEDNQDPSPASGPGRSRSSSGTQGSSGNSNNNNTEPSNPGSSGSSGQGSSGSSGGTPGGACPPCDGNIRCDLTVTGQPQQTQTLPLETKDGVCQVKGSSSSTIVVACGGQLTQNGQPVGTWANCSRVTSPTPSPTDAGTGGGG